MKLDLTKYSGAKNVFLIRNKPDWSVEKMKTFTQSICDPYSGFFADGAVFLEQLKDSEFKWHFYNSDGSSAEMCGNAVRCVHAYIKDHISDKMNVVTIQTLSGKITSEFKSGQYHVKMNPPVGLTELSITKSYFSNDEDSAAFDRVALADAVFVDTGVPHLVVNVKDWDHAMTKSAIWFYLRNHKQFSKGTNVTLVQSQKNGEVRAITFERGVDNFTQACGTGAVAAAIAIGKKENRKLINISMPGGKLIVDLNFESPILIGSASEVGSVSVEVKE